MTVDSPSRFVNLGSQTRYAHQLAERREIAKIEQLANFGLAVGWVCTLVGGFCWFCVISRWDTLWICMFAVGLGLLPIAVIIPELLDFPCRIWMRLAHWQGWLVMNVLLTFVYFVLITPVGRLLQFRKGTRPFYTWDGTQGPPSAIGWEPISSRIPAADPTTSKRRSVPVLLLATLGFFYQRGHYLVLPILVLLMAIGMILFFVQGSVLAPFIYTIF